MAGAWPRGAGPSTTPLLAPSARTVASGGVKSDSAASGDAKAVWPTNRLSLTAGWVSGIAGGPGTAGLGGMGAARWQAAAVSNRANAVGMRIRRN